MQADRDSSDKRAAWLREYESATEQADDFEAQIWEASRAIRMWRDLVRPVRDLASLPSGEVPETFWDDQIRALRTMSPVFAQSEVLTGFVDALSVASSTSASGVVGTVQTYSELSELSAPTRTAFKGARSKIDQVLDRAQLLEHARSSMQRLGLDHFRGAARTPLGFLEEAQNALDRSVGGDDGATSVLISLRQCIDTSITELIRRRATQEPATSWPKKIQSLGRQASRPRLHREHFDVLAVQVDREMSLLSGAKHNAMSRSELTGAFSRGLLLLNAILESVDEGKLRPPRLAVVNKLDGIAERALQEHADGLTTPL
ncbi:MAG: hypothetical protein AB7K36_13955 [Chloroflexota bacterium]